MDPMRRRDPHQLLLFSRSDVPVAFTPPNKSGRDAAAAFPPLAGRTWQLSMRVDFPAAADPELVGRLDRAGRRLARGAVAGNAKLRKLAGGLEAIAGLFDG